MTKRKANLFVVGAMRAGSTSFMEILNEHPDIYVSPIKEPHFFVDQLPSTLYSPSRFISVENYFDSDFPKPLHLAHVRNLEHYNLLFSRATSEKWIAEGSTCYLHAPEAAEKIYSYNPLAKIIILTREPIARAYSHYKMDKGLGRITTTFETELKKELRLHKANNLPWHSYLSMSSYSDAVYRFKNYFKEVLVLPFEQTYGPEMDWGLLWKFLDISAIAPTDIPKKNRSNNVIALPLYNKLYNSVLKDYFSKFLGSSSKQRIFKAIVKKGEEEMILSDTTMKALEQFFKTTEE
tara:strand:+ start:364 stop:1242 length:879 start_codon:yes stop_codon:yes gene_type:complete